MTNETNGQAIITIQQIRQRQACNEQVGLFHQIWGERVDVTEEEFRKHASKFDWAWGADRLLPREPALYRDTHDTWYVIWQDRWTDASQPSYETYKALRAERREKADAADSAGKYNEVWNSFDQAIDAANATKEKERIEWQAVWFARLYREACGITTDEWQLKEKESEAARATDADAVSTAESEQTGEGDEFANVVERDSDSISTSGNTAAAPVLAGDAAPGEDTGAEV
jgi:hypothetical protein